MYVGIRETRAFLCNFEAGVTGQFWMDYYLLTNWLAYLYGRIQSPRPDVMPDRREPVRKKIIIRKPVSKKFIA